VPNRKMVKGEKMKKEEIAPGIVIYSDVIPDSENLYKDIEKGMASAGFVWNAAAVKESTDPMVNKKTRDTSTFGIPYKSEIKHRLTDDMSQAFLMNVTNMFFDHFDPVEKDYMDSYGIFAEWHDTYGILKYGEGQQFTNHIDDHPSYHRRISTVYYLNENYTGGEINFPRFGVTLKPKANQMIVFPSTYVYNHSVSPVIEGERYAVVSWLK
jgi:Rps23 Pro-64 3,4-dihydroxylase Tpa1-like proline 4-hydroxylase